MDWRSGKILILETQRRSEFGTPFFWLSVEQLSSTVPIAIPPLTIPD